MDITAKEVLGSLFNAEDIVCFRVFDDKKDGVFAGAKLRMEAGKYALLEPELRKHNRLNRGVFFVVNYGGHDDASISRINAQFVEMDSGNFDEQQSKIDAFLLQPSMVIRTQKSLHVYWFMDGTAKVERFRGIQRQLVKHFDGDPMCVNESRVMRLPGFNHCKKDEPVPVICTSFHPERKYSQEQLSDVLPTIETEPVEKKKGTEKGLQMLLYGCDFIKHCRDDAATLSEHDWYAMITNLAAFEGGVDMIHNLSAVYPGYSEEATQRKINHFLESGTRPMTCQTIADKGFHCPKLGNGRCECKSPAALCYLPMQLDGLRAIIRELPVAGNVMDDAQTAEKFVEDYLFNQEKIIAETVILYELKEHFDFKAPCLKMLSSTYRNLNKAWQTGLKARKNKLTMDLPMWYEPTNRGLRFLPGVLAKHMADDANVLYAAENYYIYRGGVYEEMTEMEAQRMMQEKMLARETKMNQIADAERQWRLQVRKDIRELNSNPFIINVKNGMYNVLEGTLTPHTPDIISTVQLKVSYDPEANCPLFEKFLAESMGGDMAQVALLQEMMGYFLIPINSAQKCFVIVGAAGAGKSVLLRVLNDILLGKENVSNVSWQALNERFKTAELFGKLANIFADLPTKNIDDNGIFKALVGEDYLTVEKKNKNPFSFTCSARLLFSCNSIPRNFGDRSEGFYRRLIIVRFNNAVPADRRDPNLLDKFRSEADGIFMYALQGLKRLINADYKFGETEENRAEIEQYREDSDSLLSFVKDYCLLDEQAESGSTELFNAYRTYCDEAALRPYSQKKFVQQLLASFPNVTRSVDTMGKRRVIKGIRLADILG